MQVARIKLHDLLPPCPHGFLPHEAELLLDILSTEGINIGAVGSEPPPLLTLANAEAFEGITDVRKVLVDKRADPREMYKGNCAYDVAKAKQNPMFY